MNLSALLSNRWVFGAVVFVAGAVCGGLLAGCPAPTETPAAVESPAQTEVTAAHDTDAAPVAAPVTAPVAAPVTEATPAAPVEATPAPTAH